MRRPPIGAALLVATLALAGACTDDEPAGDADDGTTTTTLDPSWSPPGTEIGLGLTVPDGAHLAGPVFHRPQPVIMEQVQPDGDELEALLVVDEDPYGVFDAVAEQVRALGPEMNGSASSCEWWDLSVDDDHGGFSVEALGPVSDPPPDEASAVRCEASALDPELSVSIELRWGGELPGSLVVTASAHATDIALEDYVSTPGSPDAASAEATAAVPEAAPRDQPDVGDPFGGSANCLSGGYARMVLPEGSRLVGTEGGPDGRSVL
ncbi:MAG TPA: hypothetical protein VK507_20580, partial [Iamia sp.]|nr:hypothetical protein [Iamia sp.]